MPGPVGKRSDKRHGHRTKAEKAQITKATTGAPVEFPAPDADWHPVAQNWFSSLGMSGQSQFYEPSDIATAQYIAEAMSRNLFQGRFSGQLFAAVLSGMTELLTTEGARRRARLELERVTENDDPAVSAEIARMDDYRRMAE